MKIRDLMRRCLQKDVNRRARDAGDVRIEIEEAVAAPTAAPTTGVPATIQWQRGAAFGLAALGLLAVGCIATLYLKPSPSPQPVTAQ